MPKLTIENAGEFEILAGKRLVNALADEAHTDQLHSCVANSLPNVNRTEACSYDLRSSADRVSAVHQLTR
jgi:hypothetical protein